MERQSYNSPNQDSPRFTIQVTDSGVMMDVKNIVLLTNTVKLFPVEHVLYYLIINMNKSNRVLIDKEFQEFITQNIKISRAFFYKILAAMKECEMIGSEKKRGWYKIKGIQNRQPIDISSKN